MSEYFRDILRLSSVKQIGEGSVIKLLYRFGNSKDCRDANESDLSECGISPKAIRNLKEKEFDDGLYASQMRLLEKMPDVSITTILEDDYPPQLKNIYDPPPFLFYQGELSVEDEISVAVVGSRSLSRSGKYTVGRISRELALAGFVIISGLAMGADTIAHLGAIEVNKRTVAVLGSGIDIDVNVASRWARRKIVEKGGAVISPFLIGTDPTVYTFPARNRIISGMSLGVLVGEAKKESGSLITANFALEQGKEVFALPNEIYRDKFEGGNNLIKTGQAKLVMSVDDIIDEMPERVRNRISPSAKNIEKRIVDFDDESERLIFNLLIENSMSVDELSEVTGIGTGTLMGKLFLLEMKKLITREANNIFSIYRK